MFLPSPVGPVHPALTRTYAIFLAKRLVLPTAGVFASKCWLMDTNQVNRSILHRFAKPRLFLQTRLCYFCAFVHLLAIAHVLETEVRVFSIVAPLQSFVSLP
jgi:hypothetical protein